MLADQQIAAFVATTQPERAKAFYGGTLGLPLVSDDPHALVFDNGATMLRVQKVKEFTPHLFTALGWNVADIGAKVDELTAKGVAFERYEILEQDARGIWTAPDGSKIAWFLDPDGTTLSLAQIAGPKT